MWLQPLRGLPPFPNVPSIHAEDVRAVLRAAPLGRCPGLDDWSVEELRLWPEHLHEALAALLRVVEEEGRWPVRLGGAEVVLLPKGDGDPGDALNRRPINLLSMVYRIWARLRGDLVGGRRKGWDPALQAARLGADGQAWELSWAAGMALAEGRAFGGAAVDFKKAYDGVRLPLLGRALQAAGWDPKIAGPLLAAYQGARRIRVSGALGEAWEPRSGVPAGCPMAVAVLAVLTWPWASAMARVRNQPSHRRYVDDLTFWGSGTVGEVVGMVQEGWEVTRRFADALQLAIHGDKSALFGLARPSRCTESCRLRSLGFGLPSNSRIWGSSSWLGPGGRARRRRGGLSKPGGGLSGSRACL